MENGKRRAYWGLVESYRTARGPRQRVVAWLGKLDQAGRLGVQQAVETETAQPTGSVHESQKTLFDEQAPSPEPRWVEINAAGVRVENCRQFGGPWLALACYDLIRDGRQVVSLRPSDAARGTSPHGRPSQSPKDRAAA